MPHRNRVIVVDDKIEDGEAIIRRLWKFQIPGYFFHYDGMALSELLPEKKFEGVRLIFQDIALVSPDIPDHNDYGAAASGIDKILSDENGPWLLVTWSTWGSDPDAGDKYAKALYEYLKDRLPEGKKPYHYVVLDKQPYAKGGLHGEVKPESDFTEEENKKLIESLTGIIEDSKSIDVLNGWENAVKNSASRVINALWRMVDTKDLETANKSLNSLLYEMALAAEGKRLVDLDDYAIPLYRVLSGLLLDRVSHLTPATGKLPKAKKNEIDRTAINTMLHWEAYREGGRTPGLVYLWPDSSQVNLGGLNISKDNLKTFIVDAFISAGTKDKEDILNEGKVVDEIQLVIMDITAACDYSNKKNFWRKFIVGVKIPSSYKELFYSYDEKYKRWVLEGDYRKDTPCFKVDDQEFLFLFNSRLTLSLNDEKNYICGHLDSQEPFVSDVNNLQPIGRIKEQLLQDFTSWLGGMATRPGIVSLR